MPRFEVCFTATYRHRTSVVLEAPNAEEAGRIGERMARKAQKDDEVPGIDADPELNSADLGDIECDDVVPVGSPGQAAAGAQ